MSTPKISSVLEEDNNKDKHDAVVDVVLSTCLVKPVSIEKLIKAELFRKLYNIPEPFKKFKKHIPFTIGNWNLKLNNPNAMYALSSQTDTEYGKIKRQP